MANITDYVKWRGDLSFSERGFRLEDNLVLSELVYIDFSHVLNEGKVLTLSEAVMQLHKEDRLRCTRASAGREEADFAIACASCLRFGAIKLIDYQDITDPSEGQFAAITFLLDDGAVYIAFRGTDNTIIGWKEDFMISYTKVSSQELAYSYAKKHIAEADGKVLIGGHSKGAHLALYASAHLSSDELTRVERIFINDGPGFCSDVLDTELVKAISHKLVKITPEYSVIGRIFEPEADESIIIKSSNIALMQHNMHSWVLDENGPVGCSDHAPESHLINDTIHRFVEGMDLDARENFINSLFDSMAESGAATIKEFASKGPAAFENIFINMAENDALSIKKKARKIKTGDDRNRGLLLRLWGTINRNELLRIGLTLLLSILCFSFPGFAMESLVLLLLLVICIYEVVLTIRHLKESEWNFKKERPRVTLCIVLWVLSSAVLVKEGALLIVSSAVFGIAFLALAYQCLVNMGIYKKKLFERFRYAFEGIVNLLLGGYILIVPEVPSQWYMTALGTLLFIDAIFETLKMLRDRRKSNRF